MWKIFCPRKFPIQIIGYKNNFGPNRFWVKTIFGLKKILGSKNLVPTKYFGQQILCQKIFWDQNIVSNKILGRKKIGSKKFLGLKKFGPVKILGPKMDIRSEKCWVRKTSWSQKILNLKCFDLICPDLTWPFLTWHDVP